MQNIEEQRKHDRIPLRTDVYVSGEGFSKFKTRTMDLSDGGLFVEGEILATLKVDEIVQIQLANVFDKTPLLKARIAWTNRYGAGIEYLT